MYESIRYREGDKSAMRPFVKLFWTFVVCSCDMLLLCAEQVLSNAKIAFLDHPLTLCNSIFLSPSLPNII